jgi:hypothetical protein
MGDCLLRAFLQKLQKQPTFLCYFFPKYRSCINFAKKGLGCILGDFFSNSSGHPAPRPQFVFSKHGKRSKLCHKTSGISMFRLLKLLNTLIQTHDLELQKWRRCPLHHAVGQLHITIVKCCYLAAVVHTYYIPGTTRPTAIVPYLHVGECTSGHYYTEGFMD